MPKFQNRLHSQKKPCRCVGIRYKRTYKQIKTLVSSKGFLKSLVKKDPVRITQQISSLEFDVLFSATLIVPSIFWV